MISRWTMSALFALTGAFVSPAAADQLPTPDDIPVPVLRPADVNDTPSKAPEPSPRPPVETEAPKHDQTEAPKSGDNATTVPEGSTAGGSPKTENNPPPITEDKADYDAGLKSLKDLGADFEERPPIDDGNGCGINKPLAVRSILPGIELKPEAIMRCKTALQLTRWMKETVIPAGQTAYGADKQIKVVNQANSYMCRNRNNAESGKISEHAHGNAIDVSGFTFSDGSTMSIGPRERDATMVGAFQRAIEATGCLYFTTVLGPGSDDAHETHLHLDVIERKAGYRYCW